ncbi:MAG TPA: HEAT repeat domain-containing protein [Pyrinomonadaceae bacterium]|nr:HEAT repeat domain-containing protein [Pyrinomonadaceae bacterium]
MRFGFQFQGQQTSLLLALVLMVAGLGAAQTPERSMPKSSETALRLFREGKESIENQNWTRAGAVFDSFITTYPKDKNVDQALYWLAFALNKQAKYRDAEQRLKRLLKEFPQSNWIEDAAAMQIELASRFGNDRAVEESIKQGDTEVRVVALKSLFQTNPDRAFTYAETIFAPGSESNPQLKRSAIALMGQYGGSRATALLTKVVDAEADPKLQRAAIAALGRIGDITVLPQLRALATNSNDDETVNAVLFAISQYVSTEAQAALSDLARSAPSIETRRRAIDWLGKKQGEAAIDQLTTIYAASQDAQIKNQVLRTLSQIGGARASARLFDIARGADELELRKQAVLLLGQQRDVQVVRGLIQFYNSETNTELKDQVLFSLRQSNNSEALNFLEGVNKLP